MRRSLPLLLLLGLLGATGCGRVRDPLPGFPRLVLWAWERPEDLSYIVPGTTGVAYLAETIGFGKEGLEHRPRLQPLLIPAETQVIAVVRVEPHGHVHPPVTEVAEEIQRAVRHRKIRAVQIDFDARLSERAFYRELIAAVRRALAPEIALQMTALVSWCQGDDWIRSEPVTEAVPMFFRMGADPHITTERLREPLCAASIGIATDEFYVNVPPGKRVFVFDAQPWTEDRYRAVLTASRKW